MAILRIEPNQEMAATPVIEAVNPNTIETIQGTTTLPKAISAAVF